MSADEPQFISAPRDCGSTHQAGLLYDPDRGVAYCPHCDYTDDGEMGYA